MGNRACALFFLNALLCLSAALTAQDNAGMHAEMSDYILPQYRERDNHLQFIIFGDKAVNKGAQIFLEGAKIDVLQNEVGDLEMADIFIPARGDRIPNPYDLSSDKKSLRTFWSHPKQRSVRAWIYADQAVYDKNTRVLRSDGKASFRSREIDVDGVGFDAFHEKKFIHIRSKVRVVIRPEIRKTITPDDEKTGETKQEK